MVFWTLVARVVDKLPPFLAHRVPSRYSILPGLHEAIRKARLMHLGVLVGLTMLMVTMVYMEDRQTLNHLKEAFPNYYLARVPPHPKGLSSDQVWGVITQLVTSAVLNQNITHNGTFKGVVSLRQFRLTQNETRSFFPDCDYSRLDQGPLEAPNSTVVPSAYHYRPVLQVSWVCGHRCIYPPEGYNAYLGDLEDYTSDSNYSGVDPQVVLNESLSILNDLQRHSWVDNLTMALLVTLLTPMPGTATPAAITIIFENPVQRGSKDSTPAPRWWSSHSMAVVDLRPNVVPSVLLTSFLFVHLLVMWFEVDVSFDLVRFNLREGVRRCITLANAVHVITLALHIVVVCLHYSSIFKAHYELSKYYVSFDMRFNPDKFKGMNTNITQITLAPILSLKTTRSTLLSLEVVLYLLSFTLYQQHYNTSITIFMRTLRGGLLRALPIIGPLLALLVLVSYIVHVSHPVEVNEELHTFSSTFKEALCTVLGPGKGVGVPWTAIEWMVGVTMVLVGVVNTVMFWRVCRQALNETR